MKSSEILNWMEEKVLKILAGVLGVLIVGASIFLLIRSVQFNKIVSLEANQMLAEVNLVEDSIVAEADIAGLPAPVQRYMRFTGIIGKERINFVRLKHRGVFKTGPDKKELPIDGTQYFTANPPALLWIGRIKPSFFMSVTARDRYIDGKGNMLIKLLSAITIADARGPQMNEAALQRFLAENVWFPTAFLPNRNLRWEAVDDQSARAVYCDQGIEIALVFYFNEAGEIAKCTCRRYMEENGKYVKTDWSGYCRKYKEFHGIRIPSEIEAVWHLGTGDFSYARFVLETADFNVYKLYEN